MLVQIRDNNTGTVIKGQQISNDSGTFQQVTLANKLLLSTTWADEDVYFVVKNDDNVVTLKDSMQAIGNYAVYNY